MLRTFFSAILLTLLAGAGATLLPASIPTLTVQSKGEPTAISMPRPDGVPAYSEAPPWFVAGGWRQYLITTSWTYMCSSPDSLLSGFVSLAPENCTKVADVARDTVWGRNYNGVFSTYFHTGSVPVIYAVTHGENKNEKLLDGTMLQNTVNQNFDLNPNLNVANCRDGHTAPGVYQACWDAYHAFVGMMHIMPSAENGWGNTAWIDDGPIVWPDDGYVLPSGSKSSSGLRHPTFFPSGEYLYVYYIDTSPNSWGVKVARAKISELPHPSAFKVWNGNGFTQSSLPAGFSKENTASFLSSRGAPSQCLFGCFYNSARFSVAKLKNTDYFVGVEEYNNPDWTIGLRVSTDLVHWSEPTVVRTKTGSWDEGDLHYPILLDKEGWNHVEVDADEFYIIGTTNAAGVQKMRVSILGKAPTATTGTTPEVPQEKPVAPRPAVPTTVSTKTDTVRAIPTPQTATVSEAGISETATPSKKVSVFSSRDCKALGLERNLSPKSRGEDVKKLQEFLAAYPAVYPEGDITGYYGALTTAAVQRWQIQEGIVSSGTPSTTGYGAVGPKTRTALATCS